MALPGGERSSKDESQNTNNNNNNNNSGANNNTNSTKATDQDDRDFDPTAEALIDEIDDERTLEEEEALDGNNPVAVQNELDDLKKESEMPIEELLAYYQRMRNEAQGDDEEDDYDDNDDEEADEEDEEDYEEENLDTQKQESNSNKHADTNQPVQHQPQLNQTSLQHQLPPLMQSQPYCNILNSYVNSSTIISSNHQQPQQQILTAEINSHQVIASQSAEFTAQSTNNESVGNDLDIVDSSTGRHKHSMTEFIVGAEASGMFKTLLDYDLDDSDEMDEDYSYTDDENVEDERDWRRAIHVGPDYQADVPEGLSEYDDLPPYQTEDKLVWRCNPDLSQDQILDYLKRASLLSKRNDISISPASVPKISDDSARLYRERMQDLVPGTGYHTNEHNHENISTNTEFPPPENLKDMYMSQSRKRARIDYELEQENAMDGINQPCGDVQNHLVNSREDTSNSASQDARPELSTEEYFQDEEQLLFLLLQCNYNLEEAMRRRRLDPFKYYLHEPMSLWSQEECLGFEHGLRIYGKDFRSIRDNKVQTRTHAEVVAFYYLWKKSERHDVYTNQYKLDRKRCLSHPGTTDYMDKFIEDNESILNATSSSPTPTPTESTAEINQIADAPDVNTSSITICHSSNPKPASIQYINLPHGSTMSKNHYDPHQEAREDKPESNNSVYIDSNTPI